MMDEKAFGELVDEIKTQGYTEDEAVRYAGLIGDMPVTDGHGNIIVLGDNGIEVARLKPLKFFET